MRSDDDTIRGWGWLVVGALLMASAWFGWLLQELAS